MRTCGEEQRGRRLCSRTIAKGKRPQTVRRDRIAIGVAQEALPLTGRRIENIDTPVAEIADRDMRAS